MLLDLRTNIESTAATANDSFTTDAGAEDPARLLINVCIAFAFVETFFVIAFILSWHFNRDNNTNNTKGVYALILAGYIFCFAGVVIGIRKSVAPTRGLILIACSEGYHGRRRIPCAHLASQENPQDAPARQSPRSNLRVVHTIP